MPCCRQIVISWCSVLCFSIRTFGVLLIAHSFWWLGHFLSLNIFLHWLQHLKWRQLKCFLTDHYFSRITIYIIWLHQKSSVNSRDHLLEWLIAIRDDRWWLWNGVSLWAPIKIWSTRIQDEWNVKILEVAHPMQWGGRHHFRAKEGGGRGGDAE